jgi:hypothetical protein
MLYGEREMEMKEGKEEGRGRREGGRRDVEGSLPSTKTQSPRNIATTNTAHNPC